MLQRMRSVVLEGEELHIRFPYHERLVAIVRAVPGRRWDGGRKLWVVPAEQAANLMTALKDCDFSFDDLTRARCADGHPVPVREPLGAEDDLTVSRLSVAVEQALCHRFPDTVWIVGTLSGYDKGSQANKDWLRFSLVEEQHGGKYEVPALLRAQEQRRLAQRLANSEVRLEDGVQVRLAVLVRSAQRWGKLELRVQDIDPTYTLGVAARRRQEILNRLRAAGLLGANRRQALPLCPLRVGIVTKLESDAFHDVVQTLVGSGFAFSFMLAGVRVQGTRTEETTLAALEWLRARSHELDVVIVCRGGGSQTDLGWFDSEALARAVATFPLPVLIGIGHEADRSVLDEIGHSYKTPTAAAQAVVAQVEQFYLGLQRMGARLAHQAQRRIEGEQRDCEQWLTRVQRRLRPAWRREQDWVQGQMKRLREGARRGLRRREETLQELAAEIGSAGRARQSSAARALEQAVPGLLRAARRLLKREQEGQKTAEGRLRAADPQNLLNRGYAILRREDGGVVTQARTVRPGTPLVAQLREGELRVCADGPVPRKSE